MQFKQWLNEAARYSELINVFGHGGIKTLRKIHYSVYVNPTQKEIEEAFNTEKEIRTIIANLKLENGKLRGILTNNGDIYVWAGEAKYHEDIINKFGLSCDVIFYIAPDLEAKGFLSPWEKEKLKRNPNFQRIMAVVSGDNTAHVAWKKTLQPYKQPLPGTKIPLPYD